MKLVIVESPAKAKTIEKYLGPEFVVESSIGHIRDIPASAKDAPQSLQDEWRRTRFGIDVDNDFKPLYVVTADKRKQVTKLKQLMKEAEELYLATDEDREGEAIAWHLLEVLNPRVPVHRMVFREITKKAIQAAVDEPRDLDRRLVDAQEARRILDRLFGYEVSPVLWRKVKPRLSAGRVQSPAIRIIVQRERDRMAFVRAGYWDVAATLSGTKDDPQQFPGTLIAVDGARVATGKDFDSTGQLTNSKAVVLDEEAATALAAGLEKSEFTVASVEAKPYTRKPVAPFRTSTLQQEASRKLRFGARRAMSAAQRLYEGGFITYMRTDSTTLSDTALDAARTLVTERYGPEYLPDAPRTYGKKVAGAQEAHEAIRPSGDEFTDLEVVAASFGPTSDESRLYELVWKRTVASQMKDAKGESVQVRIAATAASGTETTFAASGKTILFPGFLRAYVEGSDDPEASLDDQETPLPVMAEGDQLTAHELEARGHETKPPARFTEASLVKRLEELGIGRPSTYASIIERILDRDYAYKRGTALVPTFTAFATVNVLEDGFSELVDYEFTARMETDLDGIATGDREAIPWLHSFYFGNGHPGLKKLVDVNIDEIDARAVNSIPIGMDADGVPVIAKAGRYGPYLQRGEKTASLPDDIPPDEVTLETAIEILEKPSEERELGVDPETELMVFAKPGRYGPYVQLGVIEPGSKSKQKPKTASLFKTMSLDSITLEEALQLLSQPRVVGQHPEDEADVTVQNGRYGPYLKWNKETRSLESEEQIFAITLEEALVVLAQPKRGRAAAPPLKELGEDPVSKQPVVVKSGRYGPYVTDGEYNASLKASDNVDTITLERAAELLADRRERGPAKKKKRS